MKSAVPVPGSLAVEVTRIAGDGFSVRTGAETLFVSFAEFPWFRTGSEADIRHVESPSPEHLYWPELGIDLELESIRHPEKYPRSFGRG